MLISIKEHINKNYPEVKIISATIVAPLEIDKNEEIQLLKFYDITFEYKGKKFSKLFHTRQNESVEDQFKEALSRYEIPLS